MFHVLATRGHYSVAQLCLCRRCLWNLLTLLWLCPSTLGTSLWTCPRRGPRRPLRHRALWTLPHQVWHPVPRPQRTTHRRDFVQEGKSARRFQPRVTPNKTRRASRSPCLPAPLATPPELLFPPATGSPTCPRPCSVCPLGPPYRSSQREMWLPSPLPVLSSSLPSTAAGTTLMVCVPDGGFKDFIPSSGLTTCRQTRTRLSTRDTGSWF